MIAKTPKENRPEQDQSTRQTNKPWKGVPEKEQLDPEREKPDLEKWNDTNTH